VRCLRGRLLAVAAQIVDGVDVALYGQQLDARPGRNWALTPARCNRSSVAVSTRSVLQAISVKKLGEKAVARRPNRP
jgi:hypothetical protein